MPNIMGLIATPIIRSVRNSAVKYGGMCTWEFSQIQDPVGSIIKGDKVAADGICEMLSAKWIELHAKGDALPNWITTGSGKIDGSKVRSIMQVFIIGMTMNPGAIVGNAQRNMNADQTAATRRWLQAKGLRLRKVVVPNGRKGTTLFDSHKVMDRGGSTRANFSQQMAQDIAGDWRQGTGSYRTIGIWGPGGAHAMAAWVAQDVAFFDPNYGEFWFESRLNFIKWWPKFMDKSFYRNPKLGMSDKYEIMDYALAVGK